MVALESRRQISLMGEAVHGATALKDRAPRGCIYVDPDTYLATRDAFAFAAPDGDPALGENGCLPPRALLGDIYPAATSP